MANLIFNFIVIGSGMVLAYYLGYNSGKEDMKEKSNFTTKLLLKRR